MFMLIEHHYLFKQIKVRDPIHLLQAMQNNINPPKERRKSVFIHTSIWCHLLWGIIF